MRKKPPHIIAWIIVLLVISQNAFSQNPVSVKATVNRKQILIGEPIHVSLELKAPIGADVSWFAGDSIPHFEFVEKGKIDSAFGDNERSFRQDIVITSFDSGTWVFPSLPLQVNGTTYLTDSATIDVHFSKFNPNQDYHDIKDIVEVANPYAKYIVWAVAGITLLSFALVV